MNYFILNLQDGDRDRAVMLLEARRWIVGREERHRDALAAGDLVLVFVAASGEFVALARLESGFTDPLPFEATAPGVPVAGVRLAEPELWARGVPLADAVRRIDPTSTNPYVQANASGFRSGVVNITAGEYRAVLSLADEAARDNIGSNRRRQDPYASYKFRICVGQRDVCGAESMVGLPHTSGSRKAPGRSEFDVIVVERGVTHDADFAAWASRSTDSSHRARLDLTIEVADVPDRAPSRYRLRGCSVAQPSGESTFPADGNGTRIERLVIGYEGVERDGDDG